MKKKAQSTKPDETASSVIKRPRRKRGKRRVAQNEIGDFTPSRQSSKDRHAAVVSDESEYVLEREADGRYRIVRRVPRAADPDRH